MFLDDLGHEFKDLIIFVLIVLSMILSFSLVNLDNSLKWWHNKALEGKTESGLKINTTAADVEDHRTIKWVDTLAWINIGILIGIFALATFYFLFYKPNKLGNFNKKSSPGTGTDTGTDTGTELKGFKLPGSTFGRRY